MPSTFRNWLLLLSVPILLVHSGATATAADWPMWRHDAGRSAATTETLAKTLHRQWTRHLPKLQGAWLDQDTVRADAVHQPIVAG